MLNIRKHFRNRVFQYLSRLSYGRSESGNALIHGENLAVLRRLNGLLEGKVRCIYIDPPYNNRERYTHFRDDLGHETWLRELKERLPALFKLLDKDGSLWISIDDNEVHYLKVAIDSLLGRQHFVSTIVWQHRTSRENRRTFSNDHEYLLVYARDPRAFREFRNKLQYPADALGRFKNPDNDPRGPWQSVSLNVQAGHATPTQFYSVTGPRGDLHLPPKGRCWAFTKERMHKEIQNNNIWFGTNGKGVPRLKYFLGGAKHGLTPPTLWSADEAGTTLGAKKHLLQLLPSAEVFDTPKPEQLIYRILEISTNPGDLVLDAYLGSGTTAAVALKMRRHIVGIEEGNHVVTHCASRLRKVIKGEPGGISHICDWKGGSGFDFLRLLK